jgi:uncharacterized protein YacL (UPF0231 family)
MGFLKDRLVGDYKGHAFEVRADNDIWRGLPYKLFIDGEEVANAQNFLKIPTERTLEAQVELDGEERKVVLVVKQRMLRADFNLSVDGETIPLTVVE